MSLIRGAILRVIHQTGRRGGVLAFLATLDLGYGYSILAAPGPLAAFNLLLPPVTWGWIWLGAGAACVSGIFLRTDWPQYTTESAVMFSWAAVFMRVWLFGHLPRGWVPVIIWMGFALTVLMISGWPETPPERPRLIPPEEL